MRLLVSLVVIASLASPAMADDADRCVAALVGANVSLEAARVAASRARDSSQAVEASRMRVAAEAQHASALALCPSPKWFDPRLERKPGPSDPWEAEALPDPPQIIPVPGVPYLVDPVVERECPGPLCPIVVIVD